MTKLEKITKKINDFNIKTAALETELSTLNDGYKDLLREQAINDSADSGKLVSVKNQIRDIEDKLSVRAEVLEGLEFEKKVATTEELRANVEKQAADQRAKVVIVEQAVGDMQKALKKFFGAAQVFAENRVYSQHHNYRLSGFAENHIAPVLTSISSGGENNGQGAIDFLGSYPQNMLSSIEREKAERLERLS